MARSSRLFPGIAAALTSLGIAHGAGSDAAPAHREPVLIANASSHAIVRLYVDRVDRIDWSEALGGAAIAPGAEVRIVIPIEGDFCRYDFKATFDDDAVVEQRDVDVCKVTTVRFAR